MDSSCLDTLGSYIRELLLLYMWKNIELWLLLLLLLLWRFVIVSLAMIWELIEFGCYLLWLHQYNGTIIILYDDWRYIILGVDSLRWLCVFTVSVRLLFSSSYSWIVLPFDATKLTENLGSNSDRYYYSSVFFVYECAQLVYWSIECTYILLEKLFWIWLHRRFSHYSGMLWKLESWYGCPLHLLLKWKYDVILAGCWFDLAMDHSFILFHK
jgi:hypothetical protein